MKLPLGLNGIFQNLMGKSKRERQEGKNLRKTVVNERATADNFPDLRKSCG
jgi:hypothetical protein